MKYLLDSNVLVRLLRARQAAPILARLEGLADNDAAACSIVRAELVAGALSSQRPEDNLRRVRELLGNFPSLPFDDAAAEIAGSIRAALHARGTPIGPNDLLIAAIAVANNLTLVTHNVSEFARVPGLRHEDWELPVP